MIISIKSGFNIDFIRQAFVFHWSFSTATVTVKWFNNTKGFGFIESSEGSGGCFGASLSHRRGGV
jgi:hypothetical protein